MCDKNQRQLPKIREKWDKRGDSSDVYELLPSHMSRPAAHGCTLPEIGSGRLMQQNACNIKCVNQQHTSRVSTHLPPLPVKAAVQQPVNKLSKRSSARYGSDELPVLPAVVKQDCINKEGSLLKQDKFMPVRLIPIENVTHPGSPTELNAFCKLPDIKTTTQVKQSRPKSGSLHGLPGVLLQIPVRREGLNKNFKLPPVANVKRAESPGTDKAKKRKKLRPTCEPSNFFQHL